MIHVIAIITTQTGKRAEVLEAFATVVPKVHAEAGCIEYVPVTDAHDAGAIQTSVGPDTFVVVEKWASLSALNAHSASSHMAEYGSQVGHLIADRVIHVLE